MTEEIEINDDEWNEIVGRAEYLLAIGTEKCTNAMTNEYATDAISLFVRRGNNNPSRRIHAKKCIIHELKDTYGLGWRTSMYPQEVLEVLEEVAERQTAVLIDWWNGMDAFGLPIFRRQMPNTNSMYWTDMDEFINSQVRVVTNKLKKLFDMQQWDGTFDGLTKILSINELYGYYDQKLEEVA